MPCRDAEELRGSAGWAHAPAAGLRAPPRRPHHPRVHLDVLLPESVRNAVSPRGELPPPAANEAGKEANPRFVLDYAPPPIIS